MQSYLKGQPYILLIEIYSQISWDGNLYQREKEMASLLDNFLLWGSLKIQVDKGFVMGRQARGKGMFALVPVNHFESRFHWPWSLREGFFFLLKDHKSEGWSVLFQSFIFLWVAAAGGGRGPQSESSTSIGPTVSLAPALIQFPYPFRARSE